MVKAQSSWLFKAEKQVEFLFLPLPEQEMGPDKGPESKLWGGGAGGRLYIFLKCNI